MRIVEEPELHRRWVHDGPEFAQDRGVVGDAPERRMDRSLEGRPDEVGVGDRAQLVGVKHPRRAGHLPLEEQPREEKEQVHAKAIDRGVHPLQRGVLGQDAG